MSSINHAAAASREAARTKSGEFGTQTHLDPGLVDLPTEPVPVLRRASPGTCGTVFRALPAPEDHDCKASCYRVAKGGSIGTLCDYGHMVRRHDGKQGFGGSSFQAELSQLPMFAPFNLVKEGADQ